MMRFCPAFHAVQLMKEVCIGFITTFSNPKDIYLLLVQKNPLITVIIIIITNTALPIKPLVMYSFVTKTFQILIPKIMQPYLQNNPPTPPSRGRGVGGGVTGYTETGMMEGSRGFLFRTILASIFGIAQFTSNFFWWCEPSRALDGIFHSQDIPYF